MKTSPWLWIWRLPQTAARLIGKLPVWLQIPCWVLFGIVALLGLFVIAILSTIWGLLRGLWFRIAPPAARRDVSRLAADEESLDTVVETVEDDGAPLKPSQRRLIRRDPRLLPKPKPPANVWPRPRRRKVMEASEANRLFAATLRTRNRGIRDLLADEEQLQRWGLPLWRSEQDVADALGISLSRLRHFSIHRDAEPVCHYVAFAIPKRNGTPRTILAPKRRMKALQRTLLRELVDRLPVSPHSHGFLRGRSIRSGADCHVGKRVVMTMDLADFFGSVTFRRVRGLLIALGYGFPVATTLAVLMTESERQPVQLDDRRVFVPVTERYCVQGAPTSPGLCNSLCLRLDRRLAGLAAKYGWNYSRYADDLAFSGDTLEHIGDVRRVATQICRDEGFEVRPEKTRVMRRGSRQSVTGVVVNQTAGLSRKERRRLRAALHRLQQENPARPPSLSAQALEGRLAYLNMLNPEQAQALRQRADS